MATKKNPGHISKFLKRADKAIEDGIKKADELLDEAVEFGHLTYDDAKKTRDELRRRVAQKTTITAKKAKKTSGKATRKTTITAKKAKKTSGKATKKTAKKVDGK